MKKSLLVAAVLVAVGLLVDSSRAAEPAAPPAMSAEELAARMDTAGQGNASIRTQLEVRNNAGGKRVLQLLIKQRRSRHDDECRLWSDPVDAGQREHCFAATCDHADDPAMACA